MTTLTVATAAPGRLLPYLNPITLTRGLWSVRGLTYRLALREVEARYRGSLLGGVWAFVTPLVLLLVYTMVFGVLFQSRWPHAPDTGLGGFALALFCGLIPVNVFNECVTRSPALVLAVPHYVKRVVFPLEILPVSLLGSVLFHGVVSLGALLVVALAFNRTLPWTVILLPLVLLPLVLLSLGAAWFLASLGVFLRDLGQGVALLTTVLVFGTPVFYPTEALPPALRPWMALNPLAWVVENLRRVVLWGLLPDWRGLGLWTAATAIILLLGYAWFMKTKRIFADVL